MVAWKKVNRKREPSCVFLMIIHAAALRCCVSDQYREREVYQVQRITEKASGHGAFFSLLRGARATWPVAEG